MKSKDNVQEEKTLLVVYQGPESKINYLNKLARGLAIEPIYKDDPLKFLVSKPKETDDVL
ncbi:MAG: hypothetical protein V1678_01270 [Candidatus Aenigmatarchaeota archaeon]